MTPTAPEPRTETRPADRAEPAPAPAAPEAPAARLAPGALVRATLAGRPPEGPAAAAFRARLAELAAAERRLAALGPALGDALHASRAGHSQDFHRAVVLPLRRALHNGRPPRAGTIERLGDLPGRLPELRAWLALSERRAHLLAALRAAGPEALAEDRAALAALCREPAFQRAASFTSADLLRAVLRAGTGREDRRARKEEAGVLRYAARAVARTTPLSWFAAVGWGTLPPPADGPPPAARGGISLPARDATAVVRPNRTLVDTLSAALFASPRRGALLPHRMCSGPRLDGDRATFARPRTAWTAARFLAVEDDEVTLAATGPLRRLAELAAAPAALDTLADALGGPERRAEARAFLDRVRAAGLLVPVEPFDPQDPDPLPRLARWLRERGGTPEDRELADRIAEIAEATGAFGTAPPERRAALLATLRDRWGALLDAVGRPVGPSAAALSVLSEDVVVRRPVPLAGALDRRDHQALGELAHVAELFDVGPALRRFVRDRFVARYGEGGTCARAWDFGAEAFAAWQQAARAPAGDAADPLAAPRAALVSAVLAAHDGDPGRDAVLPVGLVAGLARRLPAAVLRRPVSYTWFVQRGTDGLLAVNQVYGGWGRFTSRFLAALDPAATRATATAVRAATRPGARIAQVRPVSGFNANLHPLFAPDEIGPDSSRASLGPDDIELAHDRRTDEVRVRVRATGEPLDVLYAGVFAPVLLPPRLAPLLTDHPHGTTDFSALVPRHTSPVPGGHLVRTPRLRHGHVVLRRGRWHLAAGSVTALRAELAADADVPAATAAKWRALLGVPEHVFLHAVPEPGGTGLTDGLLAALDRRKPQFVDLGNALHLRCLGKWLARHPHGVVIEEALPVPGAAGGGPAVELAVETYRPGRDA
ncbi:lantibiotic dehydratase [Streptomyces marincola]|uniref:Lantibiotic dehydratase N-terminal domain-containing protein n=1 Tax=Streptomyces marincola TaxID=2878388 RepID=A0A1W7D6G0_9ACTN|nr:lantibiotic dehydratase [Streptomyces marincola]ARQ72565.1 hypothetical protein CAG99_22065 [Streptomyces marincola]